MSRDWEETLKSWAKPSSDTEDQKCQNAERMIKDAIREDTTLAGHNIEVFAQGSYRNNTNVRNESDVDICVKLMDTFVPDYTHATGLTSDILGFSDSKYSYAQFKNDVETALKNKFGKQSIRRGNKAFDVHENTYRVDADVVPCLEYRLYTPQIRNGEYFYDSGTQILPDNGGSIINFPSHHYDNGVAKNNSTNYRFKYLVRGLKRLRNEMADKGVEAATPIPSYLVECLVWNCPNESFGHAEYTQDMEHVLSHTYNLTLTNDHCEDSLEINGIKYLFRSTQPWNSKQVHEFIDAARTYIGFY